MLRFLVAIDHSVESIFALRAACRLAREGRGHIEALHVLAPSSQTTDYGTGWAVHTYRREHLKIAYRDMADDIASESETCGTQPELKVVSGKAVKEIAREVSKGPFDFLFTGSVHPLEGPHEGILPKLLHKISCPIVVMKHHRPIQRVLLCLEEGTVADRAVSQAEILLEGLQISLDLVFADEAGKEERVQALFEEARARLASANLEVGTRVLQGNPIQGILELAPGYDLLILGMPHPKKPGPLITSLLKAMPCPLMLCP